MFINSNYSDALENSFGNEVTISPRSKEFFSELLDQSKINQQIDKYGRKIFRTGMEREVLSREMRRSFEYSQVSNSLDPDSITDRLIPVPQDEDLYAKNLREISEYEAMNDRSWYYESKDILPSRKNSEFEQDSRNNSIGNQKTRSRRSSIDNPNTRSRSSSIGNHKTRSRSNSINARSRSNSINTCSRSNSINARSRSNSIKDTSDTNVIENSILMKYDTPKDLPHIIVNQEKPAQKTHIRHALGSMERQDSLPSFYSIRDTIKQANDPHDILLAQQDSLKRALLAPVKLYRFYLKEGEKNDYRNQLRFNYHHRFIKRIQKATSYSSAPKPLDYTLFKLKGNEIMKQTKEKTISKRKAKSILNRIGRINQKCVESRSYKYLKAHSGDPNLNPRCWSRLTDRNHLLLKKLQNIKRTEMEAENPKKMISPYIPSPSKVMKQETPFVTKLKKDSHEQNKRKYKCPLPPIPSKTNSVHHPFNPRLKKKAHRPLKENKIPLMNFAATKFFPKMYTERSNKIRPIQHIEEVTRQHPENFNSFFITETGGE